MCIDLPRTKYAKTDKDGNPVIKHDESYNKVVEKQKEILENLKRKQAAEVQKINLTDFLSGVEK